MGDGNAVAEGGRGELLAVEHFLDIAGAAQACLGALLCKRLDHGYLVCRIEVASEEACVHEAGNHAVCLGSETLRQHRIYCLADRLHIVVGEDGVDDHDAPCPGSSDSDRRDHDIAGKIGGITDGKRQGTLDDQRVGKGRLDAGELGCLQIVVVHVEEGAGRMLMQRAALFEIGSQMEGEKRDLVLVQANVGLLQKVVGQKASHIVDQRIGALDAGGERVLRIDAIRDALLHAVDMDRDARQKVAVEGLEMIGLFQIVHQGARERDVVVSDILAQICLLGKRIVVARAV